MIKLSDKFPVPVSGHSYPEYNISAEYSVNDMVSYMGVIYVSVLDHNVGNVPGGGVGWDVGGGGDEAMVMTLGWLTK